MTPEGLQFLAVSTPEFDSLVPTGSGNPLAIGAKTDTPDLILMPEKSLQFLAVSPPEFDRCVPTGSGNCLTVGAETDTHNRILMPL